MSVYVDDMKAPYRGMTMCHLFADTTDELLAMVDKIGVQRRWIQVSSLGMVHFDICLTKRALAVKEGAIELSRNEMVEKWREIRDRGKPANSRERGAAC